MTVAELRRLFDYDSWANDETLQALQAMTTRPEKSVRWLAHIVGTQRLWLGRLRRVERPAVVWPDLTLDQVAAELERLREAWQRYLGSLLDADLERNVSYVNSKGESWTSRTGDILLQTILHGVHHRGQIASDVRAAGRQPPYTDFIEAARRGYIG
jgi:uncharacterized damage-inducible protein DinB